MKLTKEQRAHLQTLPVGTMAMDLLDTCDALEAELAAVTLNLQSVLNREKAAIAAALRQAAKLPEKLYPHDSVFGLLKNNILALVPETGALERYTEAAIAAARLEEAKWWEHLVPNCSGNPDDCLYCQRLAELRSAIIPDQSAARGGASRNEPESASGNQ